MAATTQAVILARGLGTRMRRGHEASLTAGQAAAADTGIKSLVPVGRPFVDYVLSALADAGITRVVLVIGPDHAGIREYLSRTAPPARLETAFAVQEQPAGTANAVLAAEGHTGAAPFLVLNADTYYHAAECRALAAIGANALVAYEATALVRESGIESARVLQYALLDADEGGALRAIVEKPPADHPLALRPERWVSMNLWSFTPRIFDACRLVRPSARGELEIQDAVTIAIRDMGERFQVVPARAGVLDLTSRADIALVAARLARVTPHP
jgi:dTDP-glucose pyrophosphorylase